MLKLSCNPGRMLHQALDDLEKAERTPGVFVEMDEWFGVYAKGGGGQVCQVCLAGSVLAIRQGLAKKALKRRARSGAIHLHHPAEGFLGLRLSDCDWNIMGALDSFRQGFWEDAFGELGIELSGDLLDDLDCVEIPDYACDSELFKKGLRQAADIMLKHIPEQETKAT